MKDIYVIKEGKKLRCGYTTGSCAAAAAKAAAIGLFEGEIPGYVEIDTPAGIILRLKVDKPFLKEGESSCCIVKDGGDDPDITDGMEIYAKVKKREDSNINIDGGVGIGRITRDGFWGKTGDAAINEVPRRMIVKEVSKVAKTGVDIIIYAPLGEEIGKKTFNSNIGIEGGISIVGTRGIVEPMSEEALKKSIYIEIDDIYGRGIDEIILFPGNYGERVVKNLKLKGEKVKISNYVGDVLLYCYNKGFKKVTLVGNIGKLCKLSIGIFNTHSRVADGRIESFIYYLALSNSPHYLMETVGEALTAEEALKILMDNGCTSVISDMKKGIIGRMKKYLKDDNLHIELIMYSMEYGIL